jgi:hypothetical protein
MSDSGMTFDRSPAGDLWRHTLSQIPATFGRLVYLSSLRDLNTGIYQHFGLTQQFSESDTDQVLRASHIESFEEWISFDLEGKKSDLDLYLAGVNGDRKKILDTWIRLKPFRNLIPANVPRVAIELYLSSLETLLRLLMNVHGVSDPDPDV